MSDPTPDLTQYGGKLMQRDVVKALYGADAAESELFWNFGLIEPWERTAEQKMHCQQIASGTPDLQIKGPWQMDQRRYSLWAAHKKNTGKFLPYNWQVTGSCVGAGGGNAAKTLMSVAVSLGKMEYRELFWLYTYGKSRQRDGSRGPGEGSTGESYQEAAMQDGYVAFDEDPADLGQPTFNQDWVQFSKSTELKWSDGSRAPEEEVSIGKTHLIKHTARCRSSADVLAALANGYPCTQASMFGVRNMVPSPQGEPAVRLASWDGSWAHQMFLDEAWDHPSLGLIFRIPNNWGPGAHGSPTGDEPAGGFYIKAAVVDRICSTGYVVAYSNEITGFPSRSPLPWTF